MFSLAAKRKHVCPIHLIDTLSFHLPIHAFCFSPSQAEVAKLRQASASDVQAVLLTAKREGEEAAREHAKKLAEMDSELKRLRGVEVSPSEESRM